jgi:hypothetical protein
VTGVGAAKKKGAKKRSASKKSAKRKAAELPTLYVDVDDEAAIGEAAEALVTAILAAAAGGGARPAKKARGKAKKRAKK